MEVSGDIEGLWNGFRIEIIREQHYSDILDMVRKYFCPDAPVTRCMGQQSPEDYDDVVAGIAPKLTPDNQWSLVAIDEATGMAVASQICYMVTKEMLEKQAPQNPGRIFATFGQLVKELDRQAWGDGSDMFLSCGVDRYMYISFLTVHTDYRQKRLGRELLHRAVRLARRSDAPLLRVVCASVFSTRIAKSAGMHAVAEIAYDDYKDANGRVVLRNMGEHKACTLLIMKL